MDEAIHYSERTINTDCLLPYLSPSFTQVLLKAIQHLTVFVCVSMFRLFLNWTFIYYFTILLIVFSAFFFPCCIYLFLLSHPKFPVLAVLSAVCALSNSCEIRGVKKNTVSQDELVTTAWLSWIKIMFLMINQYNTCCHKQCTQYCATELSYSMWDTDMSQYHNK